MMIHCSLPVKNHDVAALTEARRLAEAVAKLIMLMEDHDGDGIAPQVEKVRELLYLSNCYEC